MTTQKFGRYPVERELGRGGMAIVYLGHDPRGNRPVAIKVLPRQFTFQPEFKARFEREAQVVVALNHPAIVPVYDVGVEKEEPYLVMEYLPGGTLSERLERGALSVSEAARVLRRVGAALDHAHRHGVIHRDLKPDNILFDAAGNAYLADFGIVKVAEATAALTGSQIIGTPAYMSPEQVHGNMAIDGRSDIYALGVILFEMLTGRKPYQAETPTKQMMMHVLEPVPRILPLNPNLPPHCEAIIAQAMAKKPETRYQTAGALAAAVASLPGVNLPPEEPAVAPRSSLSAPRSAIPLWFWAVVALAVLIVCAGVVLSGGALAMSQLRKTATPHVVEVITVEDPGLQITRLTPDTEITPADINTPADTSQFATDTAGTELPTPVTNEPQPPTDGTETPVSPNPPAIPIDAGNASQMTQLARLGNGTLAAAVPSPDGRILAVAGSLGIWLYDIESQNLLRQLPATDYVVLCLAWSPDGTQIASGNSDATLRLWDVATGEPQQVMIGHTAEIDTVAWSPEARPGLLASGSRDRTIRIWNVGDGEELRELEGHSSAVWSVAWSPDGELLASAGQDDSILLWQPTTDNLPRLLFGHSNDVWDVAWSPDGRRLASASSDRTARIWDVVQGAEIGRLQGHSSDVNRVAWSPDGRRLLTGSDDGTVRLWDAASENEQGRLEGHDDPVWSVAWLPNGTEVVSAGVDGTVRLWEAASGTEQWKIGGFTGGINSLALSPDGRLLALAAGDKVHLWSLPGGEEQAVLAGATNILLALDWSPDGRQIVAGGYDRTARVWDTTSGNELYALPEHGGVVLDVDWSPEGSRLLTGSLDRSVRLWDAADGRNLDSFRAHNDWVNGVAWSPNRPQFATAGRDHTVRVWNNDGEQLHFLPGHNESVLAVAWSPDGTRLASTGLDNVTFIWEVTAERVIATLTGYSEGIVALAWSPDGTLLATAGNDGTVRVWDVATERLLSVLTGHTGVVTAVGWTADGGAVISAGGDGTVRLWGISP